MRDRGVNARLGAFSVIVQPVVEPMEHYTALVLSVSSEFCSQADFVIKTDDDIYIDLYATHTVLQKLMKNKKNQKVHI